VARRSERAFRLVVKLLYMCGIMADDPAVAAKLGENATVADRLATSLQLAPRILYSDPEVFTKYSDAWSCLEAELPGMGNLLARTLVEWIALNGTAKGWSPDYLAARYALKQRQGRPLTDPSPLAEHLRW
jgi:hypothetical protein